MQTTRREDCLLIVALARFSDEFRESDPELANRAWSLAIVLAAEHGWTPGEAVRLL
jgi:hypothetical protein